jgi:hypothetical protein
MPSFTVRHLLAGLAISMISALMPPVAAATLLYDGSLGSPPSSQGWAYLTNPLFSARAVQSLTDRGTILDTTPALNDNAGWFGFGRLLFPGYEAPAS